MNAKSNNSLCAGLAFLALGVAAPLVHAADKCDAPQGLAETQACAKAKEGSDALRQYIQRTRALYGLHYWDFAPRPQMQAKAAEQPPSPRAPVPAQSEVARTEVQATAK